ARRHRARRRAGRRRRAVRPADPRHRRRREDRRLAPVRPGSGGAGDRGSGVMANEGRKAAAGWLNLVIDYGPLAVFFVVYWLQAPADKSDSLGVIIAIV